MSAEIIRTPDVTATALPLVVDGLRSAVALRGRASLVLAGGSTPLPLYRELAGVDLPWERVHFVWGDERRVSVTDSRSNARSALEALIDGLDVPEEHVHLWPRLPSGEAAAAAYQGELEAALGPEPVFDVTILGLGDDGHTASLFPHTGAALSGAFALATTAPSGVAVAERLSLGARTLSRSRLVLFLVQGATKAAAFAATFGPTAPDVAVRPPWTVEVSAELASVVDAHPALAISALGRLVVVTDLDLPRTLKPT